MALEIRTTPALLGYNRTPPKLSIEQPKAQVDSSITQALVKVSGTLPKVTIDQDQAFNESGLKNNEAFLADLVGYAKQKAQESVGRIASQGTALKDIHRGGNPIADNARYNSVDQFLHEFNLVTMPSSGAQIDVIEGTLDIQVEEGIISGETVAQNPIINHQQGKLEFYMEQHSSISINYIGENLDLKV